MQTPPHSGSHPHYSLKDAPQFPAEKLTAPLVAAVEAAWAGDLAAVRGYVERTFAYQRYYGFDSTSSQQITAPLFDVLVESLFISADGIRSSLQKPRRLKELRHDDGRRARTADHLRELSLQCRLYAPHAWRSDVTERSRFIEETAERIEACAQGKRTYRKRPRHG
jgi:hypothetical protein